MATGLISLVALSAACEMTNRPAPWLPLRVLPAGDSITFGTGGTRGGYRLPLAELAERGDRKLLFVGGQTANLMVGEGHEGHPGWRSDQVGDRIGPWIQAYRPDVVILHVGTNDIYQRRPVAEAAQSVKQTLISIASLSPQTWTILATPGPLRSPKNQRAVRLAEILRRLVELRRSAGQKIRLADVHQAFVSTGRPLSELLVDSAHPTDAGYQVMAETYFAELQAIASDEIRTETSTGER